MCLYLKKAEPADVDLLYQWANDSEVRKNAFHTEPILYENHVKWFADILADATVYQYILYQGEMPIGQIRLNIAGDEALIDYSISSRYRGKGYGSKLLQLVKKQVAADKIPGVLKMIGQVKYGNSASAGAFEKCGFSKREMTGCIQYEFCL